MILLVIIIIIIIVIIIIMMMMIIINIIIVIIIIIIFRICKYNVLLCLVTLFCHFLLLPFCFCIFIFVMQVSTHAAKRKIAETSPAPRDFLKKYDELKSKKLSKKGHFLDRSLVLSWRIVNLFFCC